MSAKRFPRSPEITPRPFDGGPNPFADGEGSQPLSTGSNPYETRTDESVQPYRPVEYVRALPNRSATVLRFSIFGAALSGLSLLIAIIVLLTVEWTEGMVYCLPMGLAGVAFAVPAWRMASADLRAIRAGAMDERGERTTRIARWLGCAATFAGVMPSLGGILAILFEIIA